MESIPPRRSGCAISKALPGLRGDRDAEGQAYLSFDERLRNLQQAFQADAEAIRASGVQNVLLVDDIYTTGSTAEACTRALLSAGIEKVCFFAVCIGQGR